MSGPDCHHRPGGRIDSVAVITLCSAARIDHLRAQLAALSRVSPGDGRAVRRVVVWVGDEQPPPLDADDVVRMPPGISGLRLAAARNAGAGAAIRAGANLLVFLDADCVPGPDLIGRYRAAAAAHPDAVLCGPVTYLSPGADVTDDGTLLSVTAPHPARPAPAGDELRVAAHEEYPLFWSLSFALTPSAWKETGGFDETFEGYGGEDTDFAFRLRAKGTPLVWVGGAHAYHQHHPVQSPPWSHLDDILRNGALFARKWGTWPMTGWLEAFAEAGAVEWTGSTWQRSRSALRDD